jgi:protocatechuate 3,4-dioxygenase beta subunit
MSPDAWPPISRRRFLQGSAAVSMSALLAACADGGEEDSARPRRSELSPTPACDDGDDPTPQQTEGPFYTPDTPQRSNLVMAGVRGERVELTGRVVDTRCRPVAGALLDFWQADADGAYDNEGYRLRGHQFADRRGGFRLSTIVPGLYTGRTRHIHVKVQRRGGSVLTTQLYFPGESRNTEDAIFDEALLMDVRRTAAGRLATFTFVLA